MKKQILFFVLFFNLFAVTQAHQSDFTEHCDAICLPYLGSSHTWNAVTSTNSALYLVGNSGVCFIYTYIGGIKTVYTLTDLDKIPAGWDGDTGYIDRQTILRETPDYKQRIFFISGPNAMVKAFESTLTHMGVPKRHIKTDFFPGFA